MHRAVIICLIGIVYIGSVTPLYFDKDAKQLQATFHAPVKSNNSQFYHYPNYPEYPNNTEQSKNKESPAPVQQMPTQQIPVQQTPVQRMPAEQMLVRQTPVQQMPTQQIPVQQTPVQRVPAEQMLVRQMPVQQMPTQQIPVQQMPVQQMSVQQIPVQQTPVQRVPAEQMLVRQTPVQQIPAQETLVQQTSVQQMPAKQTSGSPSIISSLMPFVSSLFLYGSHSSYFLQFLMVVLFGTSSLSLICTYTPICSNLLGINEITNLTRAYAPNYMDDITNILARSMDKYSTVQYITDAKKM